MSLWGNKDAKTATGGVAIAANGLVTGTSTLFDTQAALGDYIVIGNKKHQILSITSNTVAHVADAGVLGGTISVQANGTYALQEPPKFVSSSHTADDANNVFGIDTTEAGIMGGTIITATVLTPGSGYFANAAVTVSGGGGASGAANAQSNSIGRVATINITNAGSSYESAPTFTVAAPAAQSFNASTGVAANGFITITANKYQTDDAVNYLVATGNTAITELANNTTYYVQASNSTGIYIASAVDGAALTLTSGAAETGHTFTGETATVATEVSGAQGVAHAGWVKRTVGTGNKAGRVTFETLVAFGTIASDASDDTQFPDS